MQDLKTLWTNIWTSFTCDQVQEIEILLYNVFRSCVINFRSKWSIWLFYSLTNLIFLKICAFFKSKQLRLDTTSIMYHIKYPPCSFPIFFFFLIHKWVFVSLKWFGSFFHKSAPLNIAVFHFVLYLLSLSSCVFSNLCGLFFRFK